MRTRFFLVCLGWLIAGPAAFADVKARSESRNTVSKLALLLDKVLEGGAVKKDDLCALKIHF